MFAYVKYGAKCPRHEEKNIVPVSEIRNFDSQNIGKRNKSYNIKCGDSYCAAIIISTDETEEAVKKKIGTKRQSLPPKDLIESASDLDNPASSAASQQAARQKSGDQVRELLQKKLDTLQNKTPRKMNKYPAVSNKHTNNILQDRTNNVPEERQANKRKNPGLSRDGIGSVNSQKTADKVIVKSTTKKAKLNSSEEGDTQILRSMRTVPGKSSFTMKISDGKTSVETQKNATKEGDTETSRTTVPGKSSSTTKIPNGKTSGATQKNAPEKGDTETLRCTVPGKTSTMKRSNDTFSGETLQNAAVRKIESSNTRAFKSLSDEVRCLSNKCSTYKDKITEQKVMIKDLTQLNMELQRDIIDYFEDFKAMAKQYEGAVRNLEGADTPPTGYHQKKSNKIHLGHNVWIEKRVYDDILSTAKTNQLFVKNMAVAVFGYRILETHSVTGKKCNKFKDRPVKPGLDGNKVLAIRDIFQHWLQTKKKMCEYDAYLAACKTGTYISHKISDLLRSAANTREKSSTEVNPVVVNELSRDAEVIRNETDASEESDEGANAPAELADDPDGWKEATDHQVDDDPEGSDDLQVDDCTEVIRDVQELASDSDAHTDGENEKEELGDDEEKAADE